MNKQIASEIFQLFKIPSKIASKNLLFLIQEALSELGEAITFQKMDQWKTLSIKLNTKNKMIGLGDKNHRKLIIEFLKEDSISLYNSSYFNRAKIDAQFVHYLQEIGPYLFTQTLTIVNKLKLINTHFKQKLQCKRLSENHIDLKIIRILQMCDAKSRSINSNIEKFKSIVQFEDDREELIKQLGKMLRSSWIHQKQAEKRLNIPTQRNQQTSQLSNSLRQVSMQISDQGSQIPINKLYRSKLSFD